MGTRCQSPLTGAAPAGPTGMPVSSRTPARASREAAAATATVQVRGERCVVIAVGPSVRGRRHGSQAGDSLSLILADRSPEATELSARLAVEIALDETARLHPRWKDDSATESFLRWSR